MEILYKILKILFYVKIIVVINEKLTYPAVYIHAL